MRKGTFFIYPGLIQFQEYFKTYSKPSKSNKNEITQFTNNSRRNLLYFIHKINLDIFHYKCFVTLTYHNDFSLSKTGIKLDLKKFLIYLKRNINEFEYLWKLELQKRKAPHFHILILFNQKLSTKEILTLHDTIKSIWIKITNCKCNSCKNFKVNILSIKNKKEFLFYVTKEMSKSKQTENYKLGRYWGKSKGLKEFEWTQEPITFEHWQRFLQLLKETGNLNKKFIDYMDKLPEYIEIKSIFIPDDISIKLWLEYSEYLEKTKQQEKQK